MLPRLASAHQANGGLSLYIGCHEREVQALYLLNVHIANLHGDVCLEGKKSLKI